VELTRHGSGVLVVTSAIIERSADRVLRAGLGIVEALLRAAAVDMRLGDVRVGSLS